MASDEEKKEQLNAEHAVQLQMLGIDKSQFEQIKENLVNLPPDEQSEFIRQLSQDYDGIEKILSEQMAIAESNLDRLSQSDRAQGVQAGDIFVASNPWTSVVEGIDAGISKFMRAKSMQRGEGLSTDRSEGMRKAFEMSMGDGSDGNLGDSGMTPNDNVPVSPAAAPPISSTAAPEGQSALSNSLRQPPPMDMMPSHGMDMQSSHPVPESPQPDMQPSHAVPESPQPDTMRGGEFDKPESMGLADNWQETGLNPPSLGPQNQMDSMGYVDRAVESVEQPRPQAPPPTPDMPSNMNAKAQILRKMQEEEDWKRKFGYGGGV